MIYKDFLNINRDQIRSTPSVMAYFIQAYTDVLGREPSCSGCSLNNEFDSFLSALRSYNNIDNEILLTEKNQKMKENKTGKTFILNPVKEIPMFTYYDKKGNAIRKYNNRLTDEFVEGFLTNGTEEEIKFRLTLFKKLPDSMIEEPKEIITDKVEKVEEIVSKDVVTDIKPKAKAKAEKEAEKKAYMESLDKEEEA